MRQIRLNMISLCSAQGLCKNNFSIIDMKLTNLIAQHIIDVHIGDNWTDVNIKNTLQNISLKEAVTTTNSSANSIAALLHHITFYNEVVLERLKGIIPLISNANGFDVPVLTKENDWMELQEKNYQSAQNLAEAVKQFPEEK